MFLNDQQDDVTLAGQIETEERLLDSQPFTPRARDDGRAGCAASRAACSTASTRLSSVIAKTSLNCIFVSFLASASSRCRDHCQDQHSHNWRQKNQHDQTKAVDERISVWNPNDVS